MTRENEIADREGYRDSIQRKTSGYKAPPAAARTASWQPIPVLFRLSNLNPSEFSKSSSNQNATGTSDNENARHDNSTIGQAKNASTEPPIDGVRRTDGAENNLQPQSDDERPKVRIDQLVTDKLTTKSWSTNIVLTCSALAIIFAVLRNNQSSSVSVAKSDPASATSNSATEKLKSDLAFPTNPMANSQSRTNAASTEASSDLKSNPGITARDALIETDKGPAPNPVMPLEAPTLPSFISAVRVDDPLNIGIVNDSDASVLQTKSIESPLTFADDTASIDPSDSGRELVDNMPPKFTRPKSERMRSDAELNRDTELSSASASTFGADDRVQESMVPAKTVASLRTMVTATPDLDPQQLFAIKSSHDAIRRGYEARNGVPPYANSNAAPVQPYPQQQQQQQQQLPSSGSRYPPHSAFPQQSTNAPNVGNNSNRGYAPLNNSLDRTPVQGYQPVARANSYVPISGSFPNTEFDGGREVTMSNPFVQTPIQTIPQTPNATYPSSRSYQPISPQFQNENPYGN